MLVMCVCSVSVCVYVCVFILYLLDSVIMCPPRGIRDISMDVILSLLLHSFLFYLSFHLLLYVCTLVFILGLQGLVG